MNKKNIFICCTEQSGENICYNILKRINLDNYNIDGVCGKNSEKYISNKFYDISEFKSIGIFEVVLSINKYLKMIKFLKNQIIKKNYDLVICIDSPDFNYQLAKSLRKSKFSNNILQIVAPTVWAWRKKRAEKFARLFDEIFLLFAFEKKYFQFANFKSTFIGHPIYHTKKRPIKNSYKYISFLMGSRENEIKKLFKYFDYLEKYIYQNNLQYTIFIPTLPHLYNIIKSKTSKWVTPTLISKDIDKSETLFNDVFISVTCSGTASLEIAKRNIPQIVIYKLNYFTELILKLIIKIKKACILNIVSNKTIIPEVVNSQLNKRNIINNFDKLLNDSDYRNKQINDINKNLPLIENDESPYDISISRILSLI